MRFENSILIRMIKKYKLLGLMIICAFVIRGINIDMPFIDFYYTREAHTAISVQEYMRSGVRVLDYITPIFSEMSKLPFEFPIFQLSAFLLYRYVPFISSVDIACRIANIIWFYLSAICLFYLCRRLLYNARIAIYAMCIYMILPFTIYWSHTAMIDYCAVFFSLLYANYYISWSRLRKKTLYFIMLVVGGLAYLTKGTTVVTVLPFFMYEISRSFFQVMKYNCVGKAVILNNKKYLVMSFVAIALPLFIGICWTKYTDYIKVLNGYTAITATSLSGWNFGSLMQRLNLENWKVIMERIGKHLLPGAWLLLCCEVFFLKKKRDIVRCVVLLISICLPICVFFNLYFIHDYYLMAVSPFASMLTAMCIYDFSKRETIARFGKIVMYSLLIISMLLPMDYWKSYFTPRISWYSSESMQLANIMKMQIGRDNRVLLLDNDWNADIFYYSECRGTTYQPIIVGSLPDIKFSYVILKNKEKNSEILTRFSDMELVEVVGAWHVYKVIDNL